MNSSCKESLHHRLCSAVSAAAQLALRDLRIAAAIAELDIQKLPGCNVDLDTAVLRGNLASGL